MKKVFTSLLVVAFMCGTAQAQTDAKPAMTKEQKQMAKDKKEAELKEAFSKAGASKEEEKQVRAILDESNEKTKPIKNDASLSDEDRKAKLDAIYAERNDAMKKVLGKEKYKVFKDIQKAQKEAAGN